MADRAIVEHLVSECGMEKADAEDVTDKVFGAIFCTLQAGGKVRIPSVGQLIAPAKVVGMPGHVGRLVRKQRKVGLRQAGIVEKSEPWEPIDYTPIPWSPPL